jgi:hypothetical protein
VIRDNPATAFAVAEHQSREGKQMNDLTKTTNGQLSTQTDDPFLQYGEAAKQTAIVGKLLKFSKGDWSAGEYNDLIEDGTQFVANMDELLIGWIRWQDMKPTDHVMGKVAKRYQPPRRSELGDLDSSIWDTDETGKARDPWQMSNYLLMQGTGDDDGELYTFTTSSRGGLNAVGDLCLKYGKAARQKPGQYPVVKIGTGSYLHSNKAFGRIKYPTFTIVGWVPKAAFASVEEVDRSPEEISDQTETGPDVTPVPDKPRTRAAAVPPAAAAAKLAVKPKAKARF